MYLIEGKEYIIDKGFRNSGKVKLVKVYGRFFCKVEDPETGGSWDTMCNRLTEIE